MTGVLSALVLRGATIRQVVSGDAGCPGSSLHSNAARIDLTLHAGADHSVYLFRWRRPADFGAAADAFADCAAQHVAQSPAAAADVVEVPPWRAYGTGWTRELNTILHEVLRTATNTASPLELTAPLQAGSNEVRYTTDRADGHGRTFASIPITVEP